jgi:hypothetical protein
MEISKVVRSSVGIRDMLFDELDLLRSGKSSPQRANSITKTTSVILDAAELELNYAKFLNNRGGVDEALNPIKLGAGV